jgi:hypothetical protein
MGAAEGIAFEEVRASKQWDTLRHQLHERFAQWLDTLETQWYEPPSTVPEVTATGVGLAPAAHWEPHRGDRGACPSW